MTAREELPNDKDKVGAVYRARAEHLEQGFVGSKVDQTPDEAYSVAGVISGAPVPPVHPGKP